VGKKPQGVFLKPPMGAAVWKRKIYSHFLEK
jgi:hypothetical protein